MSIGPLLIPGDVLSLSGDLGAGKTTFVQGLAVGLNVTEWVTSPTFILMKEYQGARFPLFHLDVYRLNTAQEVLDLGIDDYLDPRGVVVVEWGEMIEPLLPPTHLLVTIEHAHGENERRVTLSPRGERWEDRMLTLDVLTKELFSPSREGEEED